jgi:glutathione S-transferase
VNRVFHRKHAGRPVRVVWVLEELGEPYEIVVVGGEDRGGEEHRARHPLGRVPVLEDEQGCLFESAAICLHLADLHPQSGLLGAPGTRERALAYQWVCFGPAELEPPLIDSLLHAHSETERAARQADIFARRLAAVSDALGEHDYLVANRFGVADVMIGSVAGFAQRAGRLEQAPANLTDYLARLTERPAYQRALEATAAEPVSG